jgi:integrase
VAATRPRWRVAFYCSLVTNNTTAGPEEIRMLQLRDVDLIGRVLNIRDGVKNKYRMRAIPLNDEAHWALQQLVRRAESKGCIMPDHCLLPARLNPIDPHRPMESWKKAWYALRAEAGKKFPRLAHLRRYDLRHHSLTRLMEDPDSSEATIEDIAGHHFSSKMKRRYSHIRMDAKRAALSKLGAARSSGYAPIMTEGFYPRGRKPQVKAQPVDASGKAV